MTLIVGFFYRVPPCAVCDAFGDIYSLSAVAVEDDTFNICGDNCRVDLLLIIVDLGLGCCHAGPFAAVRPIVYVYVAIGLSVGEVYGDGVACGCCCGFNHGSCCSFYCGSLCGGSRCSLYNLLCVGIVRIVVSAVLKNISGVLSAEITVGTSKPGVAVVHFESCCIRGNCCGIHIECLCAIAPICGADSLLSGFAGRCQICIFSAVRAAPIVHLIAVCIEV